MRGHLLGGEEDNQVFEVEGERALTWGEEDN